MSQKNPSAINLQNRFDNLIVTKVNQIEIYEPQDHTTTNYHKRCEITSTEFKLRTETSNSHCIRSSNAITESKNNT